MNPHLKGMFQHPAIMTAGARLLGAVRRSTYGVRSLRVRLLLLTLASALPVTAFAGLLLTRLHERERAQLEERLQQTAQDLASDLDRQLGSMVTTLKALATSPLLAGDRLADFSAQARAAVASMPVAILLVDPQGKQLINTRVEFGKALPHIADGATLAKAIATRESQVSNLFIGNVFGQPTLNVHVPVMRGDDVRYVLLMAFDPMLIRDITRSQFLPPAWMSSVFDANRRVIARSADHERYLNAVVPKDDDLLNRQPGVHVSTSLTGSPVLRALVPLKNAPWVVAATVDASAVSATARRTIIALLLAGCVLIGLGAVGAIVLSRTLSREFKDLIDAAERLDKGRAITINPGYVTEINELKRTIVAASERSQAHESERDLLVRELSHRVKNSFAVLQSILNATLRSGTDPATFAENFRGRLHSMAAAQDILTTSEWQKAELEPLARSQLAAYLHQSNPRITISGERVVLPAALAVPVGLILHELGTNAAKYGSLSLPDGKVELSWTQEADSEGSNRLLLVWRELDGPPVSEPEHRGFGTTLIERSLPHATVERHFDASGLRCSISFPLKRSLDGSIDSAPTFGE